MTKQMTIVLDLEGIVLEKEESPKPFIFGPTKPDVSEFLREMKAAGYKVIVHVSRPREEESAMMDYLEAVGIAELVSEFNFGERIKGGCIAEGVWTMRELADAIHRAAGREIN